MRQLKPYAVIVYSVIFVVVFAFPVFNPAYAADFSSDNFTVKDSVMSPGAGYSTSDNFRLWSNVGQPAIGTSTATSFTLRSGFLYFPAPSVGEAPAPVPTLTGSFIDVVRKIFLTPEELTEKPKKLVSEAITRVDLTNDGLIDMVDLSVLLYYYEKPPSFLAKFGFDGTGYDLTRRVSKNNPDFNRDAVVDLVDLSVLLSYWT